jgi:LacI family transcriptional regulator
MPAHRTPVCRVNAVEEPGDRPRRPPTSHDVARLAGVSQPTVSRALRDDPRVTEPTRRRVVDAAGRLGYIPSERGRSLSTRRTGRAGVVVDDLGNPFYLRLLDALHAALEHHAVRMVVLTPHRNDPERVDRLLDGSIDGAILTTTLLGSPLPAELQRHQFPFVLLNRIVDDVHADACVVDNAEGAARVGAELLALGHRTVGAILGPETTSTSRDREIGFRRVLADHGVRLPRTRIRRGPFDFATGHRGLTELMRATRRPTAIFCANDVVAIGALNAAHGLGLRVPDDLTIIGFDDIDMAGWELFELTTVRHDMARMAAAAAELLLARIEDPLRPAQRVVLPVQLVRRATHAAPGGSADGIRR